LKKTVRLHETTAPDGTVIALYTHDGSYMIRVGGVELMSTRRHNSEDKLAELVCTPLHGRAGARVLIGGLGLGFTLKAALQALASDAEVVVAEILEDIIAWNMNPDYSLAGAALRDERVSLRHADVADVLRESAGQFDGIMLDVDNGTDSITTAGNAQLYRHVGVGLAVAALRPGGRLAYWSAQDDPHFAETLRDFGLAVDVIRARAHVTSGAWHTIFVAQRQRNGAKADAPRPAARPVAHAHRKL
jgi:spermidine synthase